MKANLGDALIEAAEEIRAYEQGRAPHLRTKVYTVKEVAADPATAWNPERVATLRKRTFGYSQDAFARMLNVSGPTVRSWEQGKRVPDGPSARLLEVAERSPSALTAFVAARAPDAGESRRQTPMSKGRKKKTAAAHKR